MDMTEDAKVRIKTSPTTRSAKNLPLDMAEDVEVDGNGDGDGDETVEKSPSKKSADLQGILSTHAPEKDKFSLIVLAIVEAFS